MAAGGAELVLDASTAILLAKIDLLRHVASRVRSSIGRIACEEATVKDTDDARLIRGLIEEGVIVRVFPGGGSKRLQEDFRLDAGEAEAILIAREKGAVCATDDGLGIKCCKALGVRFQTAITLLVGLVDVGALEQDIALGALQKLERFGRYEKRILQHAEEAIRSTRPMSKGDRK